MKTYEPYLHRAQCSNTEYLRSQAQMRESFKDLSRGIPVRGLSDVSLGMKLRTLPQKGQADVLALHKGTKEEGQKQSSPAWSGSQHMLKRYNVWEGKRRKYTARPKSWWIIKSQNTLPSDDGIKTHSFGCFKRFMHNMSCYKRVSKSSGLKQKFIMGSSVKFPLQSLQKDR